MSNSRANVTSEAVGSKNERTSPLPPRYCALGDLLFRVATIRGQIVIARWDTDKKTWVCLKLITHGQPSTEYRLDNDPGNGTGGEFVIYKAPDDAAPRLYTSAYSPSGVSLAVLSSVSVFHKAGKKRSRPSSLGPLLVWRDRLVGADGSAPRIWVSGNPLESDWSALVTPDWVTRGNRRISHLALLGGALLVVMENLGTGFEIWRCEEKNGRDWQPLVIHGGYRYRRNPTVMVVVPDREHLLLATGMEVSDLFGRARPVGFEVISIDSAGRWSVLAGDCRFTPDGLQVPLWALSPGLGFADDHSVTGMVSGGKGIYVLTGKGRICCLTGPDDYEEIVPDHDHWKPDALVYRNGSPALLWSVNSKPQLQELA